MVDVGEKSVTHRIARARARVRMEPAAAAALAAGAGPKGDALAVVRIAGIQGAKRAHEWIPLCHPLPLEHAAVSIAVDPEAGLATIETEVRATARTGVEMEALAAAAAGALALYDMLKALDRAMVIEEIRVLEKRGGRSGDFVLADDPEAAPKAAPRAAKRKPSRPKRR
jgi:cyclic pyranopterin monophosphate synthase